MNDYTKDNLIDYFDFEDLVYVWNEYCEENDWVSDMIFENDQEGLEFAFSGKLLDFARAIADGSYNYQDTHFKFNGSPQSITSFSWSNELLKAIDEDEFINWLNEREEE